MYADSGQQIQSSTPCPSKCVFFQISLELCDFFMSLSGFFQEAEIHSAGLRPSITMRDLHCLHLQVATATPPFRIPFPRPWPSFSTASTSFPSSFHLPILAIRNFLPEKSPSRGHGRHFSLHPLQRRPPAAVGPRCRGHFALQGAATSSLGAPAEVAEAEGPVSCMVRWSFQSETMPKRWKSLLVWPQVWARLGNLLLHHICISRLGISVAIHTFTHALAQCLGLKLGQTLLHDSDGHQKLTYGTELIQGISTRKIERRKKCEARVVKRGA